MTSRPAQPPLASLARLALVSVALTALYAVVAATASAEPTLPADTAGAPPGGRGEEAAAGAPAGGELGAPPVGSGDERAAGVPVGGGFAVVPSSEPYVSGSVAREAQEPVGSGSVGPLAAVAPDPTASESVAGAASRRRDDAAAEPQSVWAEQSPDRTPAAGVSSEPSPVDLEVDAVATKGTPAAPGSREPARVAPAAADGSRPSAPAAPSAPPGAEPSAPGVPAPATGVEPSADGAPAPAQGATPAPGATPAARGEPPLRRADDAAHEASLRGPRELSRSGDKGPASARGADGREAAAETASVGPRSSAATEAITPAVVLPSRPAVVIATASRRGTVGRLGARAKPPRAARSPDPQGPEPWQRPLRASSSGVATAVGASFFGIGSVALVALAALLVPRLLRRLGGDSAVPRETPYLSPRDRPG